MMNRIYKFIFILPIFIFSNVSAQLTETSLNYNPTLNTKSINTIKSTLINDTLELPFYDDFSQSDIYPTNKLWVDDNTFINNSYPDTPIFVGVATFDCIDRNGNIYSHANNYTFIADTMVSKPINLDYSPSDSAYISFFVQPQGFAYDPPEERDSLVLKFKAKNGLWHSVWKQSGGNNKDFKQVLIPIKDSIYLYKGFQIQFLNYASISSDNRSSNGDYWHLDLVNIDTNRTINDTLINDVGYVTTPKSYLKDYYSIPCKHMNSTFDAKSNNQSYRNYGNIDFGIDRKLYYSIGTYNETQNIGGSVDVNALSFTAHNFIYSSTIFNNIFFTNKDSIDVYIKTILHLDDNPNIEYLRNDTAYFTQKFYNYYAYDDGVPEAGIGMDGLQSEGAELAVKFYTIMEDTLGAVRIWFNRTNHDNNMGLEFDLLVWDNDNGKPGEILYEGLDQITNFNYGLNNYFDYKLETPIIVSDTFFIGFRQNHETYMNLGFDKNNDNSHNTFYSFGSWTQSYNKGTIMIRPVIGTNFSINVNTVNSNIFDINLYPNPATNIVNIKIDDDFTLNIYNQTGQLIETVNNKRTINVSNYTKGLYFFNFISNNSSKTKKIIIK